MPPHASFLPVESEAAGPDPEIARLNRRRRLRQPVWRRCVGAFCWKIPRKIARAHRRFPLPVVALFYLTVFGGASAAACVRLRVPPPPHPPGAPAPPQLPNEADLQARAKEAIARKDFPTALAAIDALLARHPNHPGPRILRTAVLVAQKDYVAAKSELRAARELVSDTTTLDFNLAEIEFASGNYAAAEQLYHDLRRKMPGQKVIAFRLYLCARLQGRGDRAAAIRDRALVADRSAEWYYIQAVEAISAGHTGDGHALLAQARLLYGSQVQAYDQTLQRLGFIKDVPNP